MLCNPQEIPNIEGMLFVRITDTINRMLKAPLLAIGIILAIMMPVQNSFGALKTVDFTIYPDGTTHVSQDATASPQEPETTVKIFGSSIDNFVAQDENGVLLSYELGKGQATIQTFGATSISVDYDTFDLVSKKGKIWTFQIDSPVDYTITMPDDTVIVGMTNFPTLAETVDNKPHLSLPKGKNQVDYFFGVSGPAQSASTAIDKSKVLIEQINNSGIKTPLAAAKLAEASSSFDNKNYVDAEKLANDAQQLALQEQQAANKVPKQEDGNPQNNNLAGIAASIAGIGGAGAAVMFILKRRGSSKKVEQVQEEDKVEFEEITQEMREDDKELVSFLEQNGGQAFEKEMRKKFLMPRTTMWRAVKRLERQGIIEIEKKDFQNLVKLKKREEGQ